tara:strand:+ start:362 stop:1288 length:927 start_codon:yes stop_codon:yes gene_type:complete
MSLFDVLSALRAASVLGVFVLGSLMNGFVVINRQAFQQLMEKIPARNRSDARSVFIEYLLRANFEPGTSGWGRDMVNLERGQLPFGRAKMAEEIGLSERSLRTTNRLLEKLQEVTSRSTNRGTILTIVNYDIYCQADYKSDQQNDQQATNRISKSDHSKEVQPKKKPKDMPSNEVVLEIFSHFKKTIKPNAKLTPEGRSAVIEQLKYHTAVEIMQSMDNISKDTFFMAENAWRPISWYCEKRKRITMYLAKGDEQPQATNPSAYTLFDGSSNNGQASTAGHTDGEIATGSVPDGQEGSGHSPPLPVTQ